MIHTVTNIRHSVHHVTITTIPVVLVVMHYFMRTMLIILMATTTVVNVIMMRLTGIVLFMTTDTNPNPYFTVIPRDTSGLNLKLIMQERMMKMLMKFLLWLIEMILSTFISKAMEALMTEWSW